MQFTPGQLRDTIGLSVETFRHWKRVLPPFVDRKGYTPCFSIGDLLAAAILRRLTEDYGIRVGHLTKISKKIAALCNGTSWTQLENRVLLIDLIKPDCRVASDQFGFGTTDVVILCPLNPVMSELRDALLRAQPTTGQRQILFPPTEIRDDAKIRRRSP